MADHFPTFPVLPGVMMLEAAHAGGWLVALSPQAIFAKSIAVLKEARNVKYANFVAPGNSLRVEVDFFKPTGHCRRLPSRRHAVNETQGRSRHESSSCFCFSTYPTKPPEMAPIDKQLIDHTKSRWNALHHGKLAVTQ